MAQVGVPPGLRGTPTGTCPLRVLRLVDRRRTGWLADATWSLITRASRLPVGTVLVPAFWSARLAAYRRFPCIQSLF